MSVVNEEVCSPSSHKAQKELIYFLTLGFAFMNALTIAGGVNLWVFQKLKELFPQDIIGGFVPHNAWLAAVVEPVTTKLLFALFAVATFSLLVEYRCIRFRDHRLWLGLFGGLLMGVAEIYTKVIVAMESHQIVSVFFWQYPTFQTTMLAPLLLHTVNGIIIAGTVFSVIDDGIDRRDLVAIGSAVVVASAIHFVWNTWLLQQWWLWRMFP